MLLNELLKKSRESSEQVMGKFPPKRGEIAPMHAVKMKS